MAKKKKAKVEFDEKEPKAASAPKTQKELEDAAFLKVCKALGTNPDKLKKIEANKKKKQIMMDYEVTSICKINGKRYPLKGRAPLGVVQHLMEMSSKRRMAMLKEKVGSKHEIIALTTGEISSRIVKQEDAAGTELSR